MANRIIPVPKTIRHNLMGQRFVGLTVLGFAGYKSKHPMWLCRCTCGNEKPIAASCLVTGQGSCGCRKSRTKHSIGGTPEYKTWHRMISRCTNERDPSYARYGGRGITVCKRWLDSVEAFVEDMGKRPGGGYSLDRIDNNGNYEPENCRWANANEQTNNRSNTAHITLHGQRLPLTEWARKMGIDYRVVHSRIRRGWTAEAALTIPVRK